MIVRLSRGYATLKAQLKERVMSAVNLRDAAATVFPFQAARTPMPTLAVCMDRLPIYIRMPDRTKPTV